MAPGSFVSHGPGRIYRRKRRRTTAKPEGHCGVQPEAREPKSLKWKARVPSETKRLGIENELPEHEEGTNMPSILFLNLEIDW